MVNLIIIFLVVLSAKLLHAVWILNGNLIYRKYKAPLAIYEGFALFWYLILTGASGNDVLSALPIWAGLRWLGDYPLNRFLGHGWHYLPESTKPTTAITDRFLNRFKSKEARLAIRLLAFMLCILLSIIIQQYGYVEK